MTDTTPNAVPPKSVTTASSERVAATLAKRHAAEKRFRMYGIGAIGLALTFLVILFGSIITQGYSAFWQTEIRLDVHIDEGEFASREYADIRKASFNKMLRNSLREVFPKNHLMKVIQKLGQTGFIETIRGKGGGLRLAHPASEINIGSVARAMEGPLCVVECMGENSACKIESGCILKSALTRAANAFFTILDEYSLEDITKRKNELGRLLFSDAA